MTKIEKKYRDVLAWFEEKHPEAGSELNYISPYQLIVAVILSAQCTDRRVNMITPPLFERFGDFISLSKADVADIFEMIKSCSYPNNKARHLRAMAEMVVNQFKGELPVDSETLQQLPGVGRKTAHVLTSVLHQAPEMAVDTHVHRVSARIGLTKNATTPLSTEKQLIRYIPENKIARAHHWLILHGRYVCKARKPECEQCGISEFCDFFITERKKKS